MSPSLRHALALSLLAATMPATAARLELQAGRSYVDSHAAHVGFVETVFAPRPLADTRFTWSPDISIGRIDGRHLPVNPDGRFHHYSRRQWVDLVAAGARFHLGTRGTWYEPLFFSEQLAATDNVSRSLSSHYQFVSTLGWQARYFTVALRHISNGGLHRPNTGETMALIGIGLKF